MKVKFVFVFYFLLFISLFSAENPGISKYWIFFKDKSVQIEKSNNIDLISQSLEISNRSLDRRLKSSSDYSVLNEKDWPVNQNYVHQLESLNIKVLVQSRWFNAVSVELPEALIPQIQSWDFVRKIQKVASFQSIPPVSNDNVSQKKLQLSDKLSNYGLSETQNELIAIPEVHALNLSGKGILIGLIDSGFFYSNHIALSHVQVLDEYDFVFDDDSTANQAVDSNNQHDHGTEVLSIIAGYDESNLIGPAYDASYLLAKTEYVPTETKIEEDNWIAAIEWMERKGVDIVSSSLGYSTFDNGDNYSYSDMDGNTALTTIAADIAVSKGVVVVTSAGNERDNSWKYITSPADADSIITVGAVHLENRITYFSSVGPTSDGRIKPDVVAMGMSVVAANPNSVNDYNYVQGTSFSAPQVAGVAALLLEAHPSLNPMQIRDALRETADRAENPDSLYGWGLVNAFDAIFFHGPIIEKIELIRQIQHDNVLMKVYLKTKGDIPLNLQCLYRDGSEDQYNQQNMSLYHSNESIIYSLELEENLDFSHFECYFSIEDSSNQKYSLPVNSPLITYKTDNEIESPFIVEYNDSSGAEFVLNSVYPNPFNPLKNSLKIPFQLTDENRVIVQIINILGARVRTVLDQKIQPGSHIQIEWDGKNNNENFVASGVYFVLLKVGNKQRVKKLIVLY